VVCGHQEMRSDVESIFHDNYPIGNVEEATFAFLNSFTAHVNVGVFYGADFPDLTGLLEGIGKRMRDIKVKLDAVMNKAAVCKLIQHACLDFKERLLAESGD